MIEVLTVLAVFGLGAFVGGKYRARRQIQQRRQLREMEIHQQYIDELKATRDQRPFDWSVDL